MEADKCYLIDTQTENLSRNLVICTAELLINLRSKFQITDSDLQYINGLSTNVKKVYHLLSILKTKRNGYEDFIGALEESRQTGATRKLSEELTKMYHSEERMFESNYEIYNWIEKNHELSLYAITSTRICLCKKRWEENIPTLDFYPTSEPKLYTDKYPEYAWFSKVSGFIGRIQETFILITSAATISKPDWVAEFCQVKDDTSWDMLTENCKSRILKKRVKFLNSDLSVGELLHSFKNISQDTFKILIQFIEEHILPNPSHDQIVLVSLNIPYDLPTYYIDRLLVSNRKISPGILALTQCEASSNIFVIQGLQLFELNSLARTYGCDVVSAASQFRRKSLTSKIILLEPGDNFGGLCSLKPCFSTETTVKRESWNIHLFDCKLTVESIGAGQQNDNSNSKIVKFFHWIKSQGSVECFDAYVLQNDQEEVHERTLINRGITDDKHICISDGSGMGKTLLLLSSAIKLSGSSTSNCLVYTSFVIIPQFYGELPTLKLQKHTICHCKSVCADCWDCDQLSVVTALAKFVSKNACEYGILLSLLKLSHAATPKLRVELMFDGLDELQSNEAGIVLKAIGLLLKSPNIRVWVSTRPIYKKITEDALGTINYSMMPLSHDDSMSLITNYWRKLGEDTDCYCDEQSLRQQAQTIINAIDTKLTDEDRITNVPQFAILTAKIYAEDLCRSRTDGSLLGAQGISGLQIAEVYQQYIEASFKTGDKDHLYNLHIWISLQLKFRDMPPVLATYFYMIFGKSPVVDASATSHGFLLQTSTPRFIHKTFMDYFVALFVKSLCQSWYKNKYKDTLGCLSEILQNILLVERLDDVILNTTTGSFVVPAFKFQHMTTCNFLGYLLESGNLLLPLNEIYEPGYWWCELNAAVRHGFHHLVKSFLAAHRSLFVWTNTMPESVLLRNQADYLSILILAARKSSGFTFRAVFDDLKTNMSSALKRLNLLRSCNGSTEEFEVTLFWRAETLNTAIAAGNEDVVQYLSVDFNEQHNPPSINVINGIDVTNDMLLHCIGNSRDDAPAVIHRKLKIFDFLVENSRAEISVKQLAWLTLERTSMKMLQHILGKIKTKLTKGEVLGPLTNKYGENMLHLLATNYYCTIDANKYHEFIINRLKLLNLKEFLTGINHLGWSAAEVAVSTMDLHKSTVELILEYGIQLSSRDYKLSTFVYKAIAGFRSPHFIHFLLQKVRKELTAHKYKLRRKTFGETILHVAVAYYHLTAVQYFVSTLKQDPNIHDELGNTPLHILFRNAQVPAYTDFFQTYIPLIFNEQNVNFMIIRNRTDVSKFFVFCIRRESRNCNRKSLPIVFKVTSSTRKRPLYLKCTLKQGPAMTRISLEILQTKGWKQSRLGNMCWKQYVHRELFKEWSINIITSKNMPIVDNEKFLSTWSWQGVQVTLDQAKLYFCKKWGMFPIRLASKNTKVGKEPRTFLKINSVSEETLDIYIPREPPYMYYIPESNSVSSDLLVVESNDGSTDLLLVESNDGSGDLKVSEDNTFSPDSRMFTTKQRALASQAHENTRIFMVPYPSIPVSRRRENPKQNVIEINPDNQHKIAEFLIRNKAKIDHPNNNGLSPLHYAKDIFYYGLCATERLEMESSAPYWFLLRDKLTLALKGLILNPKIGYEWHPNLFNVIGDELVKLGADAYYTDSDGANFLDLSVRKTSYFACKYLLETSSFRELTTVKCRRRALGYMECKHSCLHLKCIELRSLLCGDQMQGLRQAAAGPCNAGGPGQKKYNMGPGQDEKK